MTIYDVILPSEKDAVRAFLNMFDLQYEEDIDDTIVLKENHDIIATASTSNNIIKAVAIDPAYQGHDYLSILITALIKRLKSKDITHYFLYTKNAQAPLFTALGLHPIVNTDKITLFEGGSTIKKELATLKTTFKANYQKTACVVINANPMTNGHLHLIKTARNHHSHLLVFVVSEDRSVFPFAARFAIIKETCADFDNVTVLPTGPYLVSQASFPKYFLKEETTIKEEHAMIDVLIYKHYYIPTFNIEARYVGDEPLSPMTNMYNVVMHKQLGSHLHIIPRIHYKEQVISASTVRDHLKHNDLDTIEPLVPKATLQFLRTKKGRDCIANIKTHISRH
jgi:[citrate (pro-3S)-lyase] ligase